MEAQKAKISSWILVFVTAALPLLFVACGGSSSGSSGGTQSQNGNVTVMVQDASTEDWAMIGVKVLSFSLTPQGGGTPVTVFTASSPARTEPGLCIHETFVRQPTIIPSR